MTPTLATVVHGPHPHTPGPWTYEQYGAANAAARDLWTVRTSWGLVIGPIYGEANARLIAAAPEMHEALAAEQEWQAREAAGELDYEWDYETMVASKRRAALAKVSA